jgi:hypothetical protein
VLLIHAQLTNNAMIFRLNAYFLSLTAVSLIVLAHQLAGLIPGVPQDWTLILKRVTLLMRMVSGDSVEKNVLLIHMTVIILTGLGDLSKPIFLWFLKY